MSAHDSYSIYNEMPDDLHERLMRQARALTDSSQASALPMDFDTAFTHITRISDALQLPVDSIPELGKFEALSTLSTSRFFNTAESVDAVLISGDEASRREAGVLAIDMYASLPYAREGRNAVILGSLLKFDYDSDLPISTQLARRILPDGTDEEIIALNSDLGQSTGGSSISP